jgi:DNA-binding transcriptional LysR family regulator
VVGSATGPELRAMTLFRDRLVGVVRKRHPLCRGKITPARYAAAAHILLARGRVDKTGPLEDALEPLGLERQVATIVGSFATALTLARTADLVATVPEKLTTKLRTGMHSFPLPLATPEVTIALMWHPRMDADPAHRWLRGIVREVCATEE